MGHHLCVNLKDGIIVLQLVLETYMFAILTKQSKNTHNYSPQVSNQAILTIL